MRFLLFLLVSVLCHIYLISALTETQVPIKMGAKTVTIDLMNIVQSHNTPDDCWSILGKNIYDLTAFKHTGGKGPIAAVCGTSMKTKLKAKHGNKHNNDLSIYKVINQILKPLVLQEVNKVNHGLAQTVEKLLVAKDKFFKPPIPLSSTPSASTPPSTSSPPSSSSPSTSTNNMNNPPSLPSIPVTPDIPQPSSSPSPPSNIPFPAPAVDPNPPPSTPIYSPPSVPYIPPTTPPYQPPVSPQYTAPMPPVTPQYQPVQPTQQTSYSNGVGTNNNNNSDSGSSSTGIIVGVVVGVVVLIAGIAAYCVYSRRQKQPVLPHYYQRNSQMLTVSGY